MVPQPKTSRPWDLSPREQQAWRVAQWTAVVALLGLTASVFLWPSTALPLFWNVVLPLVPAVLLISPGVWRGVCPLATVSLLAPKPSADRIAVHPDRWLGSAGIVLLLLIVPLRRVLWNQNGIAFGILLVVLGGIALVLGRRGPLKAGFCNAICPVLPVERLYGQEPLVPIHNSRCPECTLCTVRGCIDLTAEKSIAQLLGPIRREPGWVLTAFGGFAAAFPGFIVGYGLTSDGAMTSLPVVFGSVALGMVVSWSVVALVTRVGNVAARTAMPVLAAVALSAYYWFAAPTFVSTLGVGAAVVTAIRIGAVILAAGWLVRAMARSQTVPQSIPVT